MCNDYEQRIAWAEFRRVMQALDLKVSAGQSEPDLPQADDIKISDLGPVIVAADGEVELKPMSFGFPPPRARATPVFNFRSEGRHFGNSNRCLIPDCGATRRATSRRPLRC
jgi:putative SOS response-associated peptidase YedK